MSRRRNREALRNISQLDVTPLVDLTFLLLIVFMITAPALEYAVEVSPPELSAKRVDPKDHRVITLTRNGKYVMEGQTLQLPQLQTRLQNLLMENQEVEVYIRADEQRQYGEVMALMRMARQLGFKEVNLVTQEEAE